MAVNLSIKDVPNEWAERLRQRAARNHRSLQGELMSIIEQATSGGAVGADAPRQAGPLAHSVRGSKTIEQLMAERAASGWKPHATLARAPLAMDIVRAARDAR